MIHSYKEDGAEIMEFLKRFREKHPEVPVVLIPTTYSKYTETELFERGANIVIYANQLLRSAYKSMSAAAKKILEDESSFAASKEYCTSMKEILNLIGDEND